MDTVDVDQRQRDREREYMDFLDDAVSIFFIFLYKIT